MKQTTNRHNNINKLRTDIITAVPNLGALEHRQQWWLLGTSGCHLCADAENLIARFQRVYPISYQHVDIADFDELLMMNFASTIPVLLTPYERLDYPFSVMDLQRLLLLT